MTRVCVVRTHTCLTLGQLAKIRSIIIYDNIRKSKTKKLSLILYSLSLFKAVSFSGVLNVYISFLLGRQLEIPPNMANP